MISLVKTCTHVFFLSFPFSVSLVSNTFDHDRNVKSKQQRKIRSTTDDDELPSPRIFISRQKVKAKDVERSSFNLCAFSFLFFFFFFFFTPNRHIIYSVSQTCVHLRVCAVSMRIPVYFASLTAFPLFSSLLFSHSTLLGLLLLFSVDYSL